MELLPLGLNASMAVKTGKISADLVVSGGDQPGTVKLALNNGGADMQIDAASMGIGAQLTGLVFAGEGIGGMPALDLSLADVTQRFTMPTGVLGQQAPMNFLSRISDLRMSDAIWDEFDAGKLFPRDPVNLLIDLQAMVTLRVPLWAFEPTKDLATDPEIQPIPDVPIELNSLKIAGLSASGFGVDVKGSGGAELDFSGVVTQDELPGGNAQLQLDLKGVQTLMDKLKELGLLTGDELMGARMGLSMFAKPTGEGDQMTSSIELREGRFYLNGMLMR
jgi:hypothetical protein